MIINCCHSFRTIYITNRKNLKQNLNVKKKFEVQSHLKNKWTKRITKFQSARQKRKEWSISDLHRESVPYTYATRVLLLSIHTQKYKLNRKKPTTIPFFASAHFSPRFYFGGQWVFIFMPKTFFFSLWRCCCCCRCRCCATPCWMEWNERREKKTAFPNEN